MGTSVPVMHLYILLHILLCLTSFILRIKNQQLLAEGDRYIYLSIVITIIR